MSLRSLIIISILTMVLLALGLIMFVILYQRRMIAHHLELKTINEQKELELIHASIQSEENERMRIASELHDDIGATLASARLFLYKEKDTQYDELIINQSKELLDDSIAKIRNISHKLQPATLLHLGLELSLQSIMETINKSGKITASYTSQNSLPRVADNTELAAYRICQELIANMINHAAATSILLHTNSTEKGIFITFTHNGAGMTHDFYEQQIYKKGATGLKNIVSRLKTINGAIYHNKESEEKYTVSLTIPLATN